MGHHTGLLLPDKIRPSVGCQRHCMRTVAPLKGLHDVHLIHRSAGDAISNLRHGAADASWPPARTVFRRCPAFVFRGNCEDLQEILTACYANPSRRVSHSSNRGHSSRILVRPIRRATRGPWRGFRYPDKIRAILLPGVLLGSSLMSSGVANCARTVRRLSMFRSVARPVASKASASENNNPSNSYCCT